MNSTLTKLSPSERWIFSGNLLVALGVLCVSIGQILKVAEEGTMYPYFKNNTVAGIGEQQNSSTAKAYFRRD